MGHLRLVTDPPRPPGRRGCPSPALFLTAEETRHLRAAIRGLVKTRYASIAALARELGIDPRILTRRRRPSAGLAVAVWRVSGIPLDVLLRGGLSIVPASLATAPPERDPA
jgi:hypothetical protein